MFRRSAKERDGKAYSGNTKSISIRLLGVGVLIYTACDILTSKRAILGFLLCNLYRRFWETFAAIYIMKMPPLSWNPELWKETISLI